MHVEIVLCLLLINFISFNFESYFVWFFPVHALFSLFLTPCLVFYFVSLILQKVITKTLWKTRLVSHKLFNGEYLNFFNKIFIIFLNYSIQTSLGFLFLLQIFLNTSKELIWVCCWFSKISSSINIQLCIFNIYNYIFIIYVHMWAIVIIMYTTIQICIRIFSEKLLKIHYDVLSF